MDKKRKEPTKENDTAFLKDGLSTNDIKKTVEEIRKNYIMDKLGKLTQLNNRVAKVFKDPNINFFIILCLILLISCYSFISNPIKNGISKLISNK